MIIEAERPASVPDNAVPNIFWITETGCYYPNGSPGPYLHRDYDIERDIVRPQRTFDLGYGLTFTESEMRQLTDVSTTSRGFDTRMLLRLEDAARQIIKELDE